MAKDGSVSVWQVEDHARIWNTDTLESSSRLISCRWSPRGNVVLAAQLHGDIRSLDARDGEVAGSLFWFNRTGSEMRYTAIDHTGNYVAVGNADAELVYVVQTAEGQQTLLPWEFQERFDWRNDPTRVNLRKVGL